MRTCITRRKSMKHKYLLINDCTDPYYNLALEEYLLLNHREGTIGLLWQNDQTIVVGRHQNTIEEINQGYVKEHGIKVVRRTTGGGAVYHDLGNLNYSLITDYDKDGSPPTMSELAYPVIDTLESFGVHASFSGRNDIMIEGKKVSGTAQRIYEERILHHGCLLFESDLSKVSKSLNVRADKFSSKAVKSVRGRVANIRDFLTEDTSIEEFKERLAQHLLGEGSWVELELDQRDKQEIEKLKREKYETWEWNYGLPIKYSAHNYRKFPGGTVEVYLNINKGRIETCQMFGDFMALRPASEVAGKLEECRYRYKDVERILAGLSIEEYFGTVSIGEVAKTICCAEE